MTTKTIMLEKGTSIEISNDANVSDFLNIKNEPIEVKIESYGHETLFHITILFNGVFIQFWGDSYKIEKVGEQE